MKNIIKIIKENLDEIAKQISDIKQATKRIPRGLVSMLKIKRSIDNKKKVRVTYMGQNYDRPRSFIIMPYALGRLKGTGNMAIRAYKAKNQYSANANKGWKNGKKTLKVFLVDRVISFRILNDKQDFPITKVAKDKQFAVFNRHTFSGPRKEKNSYTKDGKRLKKGSSED